MGLAPMQEAVDPARAQDGSPEHWAAGIVTRSPLMEKLLAQAKRVAATDAAVCIYGASGTGKELLARAIHRVSARGAAPFVAVNCSAIPEGLLESELFGHRKGAFTGALQDRRGLLQSASGGTLFLDEIGDMPLALQVKLLRALEEKVVRPVGSNETIEINARVISATHRRLEEQVAAGEFREDLYYRLNVVKLALPSLAERREDIPLLVAHALARFAAEYRRPRLALAPGAMEALVTAAWPGNVRQLLNAVEQAVALSSTDLIAESQVRGALETAGAALTTLDQARRAFERDYLVRILKITEGNVTRAARLAGRNRTEFYRLLERHSLEPGMFKLSPRGDSESRASSSASCPRV